MSTKMHLRSARMRVWRIYKQSKEITMAMARTSERHRPNVTLFWQRWAFSQLMGCLCFFAVPVFERICSSVIKQSCSAVGNDGRGTLVILPFFFIGGQRKTERERCVNKSETWSFLMRRGGNHLNVCQCWTRDLWNEIKTRQWISIYRQYL